MANHFACFTPVLLFSSLCFAVASAPRCEADAPNIIMIMCDDLGYGDLACYNPQTVIKTPHLNQMAQEGVRFTRFYSAAPVCSPTRGSCLTGRHPFRFGIYFANTGHLPEAEITIPELLEPSGYQSGHFGKWHLGTLTKTILDSNRGGPRGAKHYSIPSMHGYHDSFVTESKVPTHDPMVALPNASKNGWDPLKANDPVAAYGTRFWNHDVQEVNENLKGDTSRVVMDRVIPFINQSTKQQKPFFATIWFHAPHLPVVSAQEYTKHYESLDSYTRNYFGCITAMDDQIGRLRKHLSDKNLSNNTILWFCSDNGPEGTKRNAPGSAGLLRGRKRSLYEGGVRVPGILVWPSQLDPQTIDTPAVTSDLLPSLMDLLEIDYPSKRPLDGLSMLPIIRGEREHRMQPIGFQSAKQYAWHDEDWKLYSPDMGKSWELYNVTLDPGESDNLLTTNPEVAKRMKQDLMRWIKSCQDSDQGLDY